MKIWLFTVILDSYSIRLWHVLGKFAMTYATRWHHLKLFQRSRDWETSGGRTRPRGGHAPVSPIFLECKFYKGLLANWLPAFYCKICNIFNSVYSPVWTANTSSDLHQALLPKTVDYSPGNNLYRWIDLLL